MARPNRFSQIARRNNTGNVSPRFQPQAAAAQGQIEALARQIADDIIRQREAAARRARLGRVFTEFDPADDVIRNNVETVTRGLFSGNVGSMTTFFTSSTNFSATQQRYFHAVYDKDPATDDTAQIQFSIAYGHFNGSGSEDPTGNLNNDTPSRAIYKQYAQLLLPPNDYQFTFGDGTTSDAGIYVLNFNRARIREKIDPGNFEINLRPLNNGGAALTSGMIRIIDDSSVTSGTEGEGGLIYNLVSGSIDGGTDIHSPASPTYFGLLYPQHGVAILSADALDAEYAAGGADFTTGTDSAVEAVNAMRLFRSISGSCTAAVSGETFGLQARSSEQVKSTYFFCRLKNAEYNYSNNPSFVTGSLGQLAFNTFIQDPQVYITTVGLYNDRKELLAVAKLSQPLLKSFTREALVKVKLDF